MRFSKKQLRIICIVIASVMVLTLGLGIVSSFMPIA